MRKADIKLDVVMALERAHLAPVPVKILSPGMWRHVDHKESAPWYSRSASTKPSAGGWSTSDTGYPVVKLTSWQPVTPVALAVLESFTLGQFARATSTHVELEASGEKVQLSLDVLTSLNLIQRPYADAFAAHDAEVQRGRAEVQVRREAKGLADRVQAELEPRFGKLGIQVKFRITPEGRLPLVMLVSARSASFIAEMLEAAQDDGLEGSSYDHDRKMHDKRFAREHGLAKEDDAK